MRELLRCLDDDGALRIDDGVAEVADDVPLTALHDTLVRRLSWLPAESVEVLRYASLLGTAFTLHDVGTVMGRSVVEVAGWLREASQAGLIDGDGDRMSFRHDLIREAVYGHMLARRAAGSAPRGGRRPRRSGRVGSSGRRTVRTGRAPGDREAIRWLERGADEVLPVSPGGAVELLEQAIRLTPEHWPERIALQARCLDPLLLSGRFDDAQALGDAVVASSPGMEITYMSLRALSAAYADRGDLTTAIGYLRRALDIDGITDDRKRLTHCYAAVYAVPLGETTAEEARRVAEESLATAGEDETLQCAAHQSLGMVDVFTGYHGQSRQHLETAAALVRSTRVSLGPWLSPGAMLAWPLTELDELDAAVTAANEARQHAERKGYVALLPISYIAAAGAHLYAGRWDDASAEVEAAISLSSEIGSPIWHMVGEAMRAYFALHRGDHAEASEHLASGTEQLFRRGPSLGADVLLDVQAQLLVAQGDVDAALSLVESIWSQTAHARYFVGHRARGAFAVRLAVLGGNLDFARDVTADLEEGARRTPVASAIGVAQRCRGMVEHDADLMLQAVAQYQSTPRRPELASCCHDAATVLADTGRKDEAIKLLHEAAAIHADLGATDDEARVDDALRALGVRRVRQRAARPNFGWGSLTPTEIGVSRLVAEGLTNPEIGSRLFISRRTVETHLSNVYRKLDITNRTMLVSALAAHDSYPS